MCAACPGSSGWRVPRGRLSTRGSVVRLSALRCGHPGPANPWGWRAGVWCEQSLAIVVRQSAREVEARRATRRLTEGWWPGRAAPQVTSEPAPAARSPFGDAPPIPAAPSAAPRAAVGRAGTRGGGTTTLDARRTNDDERSEPQRPSAARLRRAPPRGTPAPHPRPGRDGVADSAGVRAGPRATYRRGRTAHHAAGAVGVRGRADGGRPRAPRPQAPPRRAGSPVSPATSTEPIHPPPHGTPEQHGKPKGNRAV